MGGEIGSQNGREMDGEIRERWGEIGHMSDTESDI